MQCKLDKSIYKEHKCNAKMQRSCNEIQRCPSSTDIRFTLKIKEFKNKSCVNIL